MMEYEIRSFGQRLGMDSLQLSPQGIARLNISGIGSFFLELDEKDARRRLLLYLSAPLPEHDASAVRRFLELCDYRRGLSMPLSAGVFSENVILLTFMEEKDVTAAGIENTLRFLAEALHG